MRDSGGWVGLMKGYLLYGDVIAIVQEGEDKWASGRMERVETQKG